MSFITDPIWEADEPDALIMYATDPKLDKIIRDVRRRKIEVRNNTLYENFEASGVGEVYGQCRVTPVIPLTFMLLTEYNNGMWDEDGKLIGDGKGMIDYETGRFQAWFNMDINIGRTVKVQYRAVQVPPQFVSIADL